MSYLKSNIQNMKKRMDKLQVDIEKTCKAASVHSEALEYELIKANLKACEAWEHLEIALTLTNGDKSK